MTKPNRKRLVMFLIGGIAFVGLVYAANNARLAISAQIEEARNVNHVKQLRGVVETGCRHGGFSYDGERMVKENQADTRWNLEHKWERSGDNLVFWMEKPYADQYIVTVTPDCKAVMSKRK